MKNPIKFRGAWHWQVMYYSGGTGRLTYIFEKLSHDNETKEEARKRFEALGHTSINFLDD